MKWDQRFFNSLDMGGGRTSITSGFQPTASSPWILKRQTLAQPYRRMGQYLEADDMKAQDQLLMSIRTGRPAGDGKFLKLIEKLTGRDLLHIESKA